MNEQHDQKNSVLEKELEEITQSPETKLVERVDKDTLSLNGAKYEVMTDHKEALDLEMLEDRYSELLEKYDYIVGDISYGKLRLRGFYEDNAKKVPIDMRISSLDDYLLEYCSFGCKHFVLKRLDPKKKLAADFDSYSKRSQKKKPRRNPRKNSAKSDTSSQRKPHSNNRSSSGSKSSGPKKEPKREFAKKEVRPAEPKQTKDVNVQTVKDKKGNTRFQIRRKKTEDSK